MSQERRSSEAEMDVFQEIVNLQYRGLGCVLVTITDAKGSVPRTQGAKMVVRTDGAIVGTVGGGKLEKRLIEESLDALKAEKPKLLHFNLNRDLGMSCGGSVSAFIEPLIPRPKLIIFGAGHIGSALAKIGKQLGFRVVIADNRPEFAAPERLSAADEVLSAPYQENLVRLKFDDHSYIVIVTHQHAYDQEILEFCARKPFAYLGMIGSKSKVGKTFNLLKANGIDEKIIKKIHAPIGLDVGAETPAEIAVSIAAELVAVRNTRTSKLSLSV